MRMIFLVIFAFLFLGCERQSKILPTGNEVVIDVIASQSGVNAAFANRGLTGFKIANRLKPLLPNGDAIVFRIHDNASDITVMRQKLKKIPNEHTALVTFCNSDMQLAAEAQIERRKIPTLAAVATHDKIVKREGYVTRLSLSNREEAQIAASYIRDELLIPRVGVVHNANNAYSHSLAMLFKERFEWIKGEVSFNESIETLSKEKLEAFLREKPVDMLFFTLDAQHSIGFIKLIRSIDPEIALFGSDGLLGDAEAMRHYDTQLLEDIILIDHFASNMRINESAKPFLEALEAESLASNSFAFLGYEAYEMLYSALNACREYDTSCINDELRSSHPVEGLAATLRSEDGAMIRPIYVNAIKDAKMVRKVKVY